MLKALRAGSSQDTALLIEADLVHCMAQVFAYPVALRLLSDVVETKLEERGCPATDTKPLRRQLEERRIHGSEAASVCNGRHGKIHRAQAPLKTSAAGEVKEQLDGDNTCLLALLHQRKLLRLPLLQACAQVGTLQKLLDHHNGLAAVLWAGQAAPMTLENLQPKFIAAACAGILDLAAGEVPQRFKMGPSSRRGAADANLLAASLNVVRNRKGVHASELDKALPEGGPDDSYDRRGTPLCLGFAVPRMGPVWPNAVRAARCVRAKGRQAAAMAARMPRHSPHAPPSGPPERQECA
mmetsp:Transcript_25988/g.57350  ORF Transcript_25988/g.57350 Transcript_25988/m.57350 type:complete len:296 (+) Transcript_25988:1481-2368(+)